MTTAKPPDHILQSGQALLHVVLAIHAQLGGAAAGGDHHGVVSAAGHQSRRLDHGVGGGSAEGTAVGAGGVVQPGDLRSGLCEVAAATLVDIAAGLLGAVDDVLHLIAIDASDVDHVQQCQHGGCLGHQILVHDVGGKVGINIVGPLHAAYQLAQMIQSLGALFLYQPLDLLQRIAVFQAVQHALLHDGVGGQRLPVGSHEFGLQFHQIEHVAGLHQQQELVLGHHLAELAVPLVAVALLVAPGLGHCRQFIRGLVANVDLIGPIGHRLLEAADVAGQLLEILAIGVDDTLCCLGSAVVQHHIGGMSQNIAGSTDDTFHRSDHLSYVWACKIPELYTILYIE